MSHHAHENRLLLIEKVLLLKTIALFAETPETVLAEVAEILEEVEVEAEENIFEEGAEGNCLYIIFKGEVRIHKGNHTLAVLKDNEIFGELSLLDTDVRSASVTSVSEGLLLKLDQEPFYEIMETRIEVAKGIIKTLCQRLRAQNVQSVKKSGDK